MQELINTCKRILNRAEFNGRDMVSLSAVKELRSIYEFWIKINLYLNESKNSSELIGERERKQVEILKCLPVDELKTMQALSQKATDIYNGVYVVDTIEVKDKAINRYKQQGRYKRKMCN
jgi:hypothetical protein